MDRPWRAPWIWACLLTFISIQAGCAGLSESPQDQLLASPVLQTQEDGTHLPFAMPQDGGDRVTAGASTLLVAEAPSPQEKAEGTGDLTSDGQATGEEGKGPGGVPEELAPDPFSEPFEDPFTQPSEAGTAAVEEYDPLESFNIRIFNFNREVDRYVIKPVATGYDYVMPDALELGIQNFFHNVRFVPRLMNNLFQAKFKGAGLEVSRFLINTTIGLAGFFDPAKNLFNLDTPDEDWGQTLGAWGLGQGPYLVLPLLPPLTLRDATGFLFMDLALDPINYMLIPVMPYRFEGQPMATVRDTRTIVFWGIRVGEIINERSINLERFQGVEEATLDLYSAVRNAYLQKRAREVAR